MLAKLLASTLGSLIGIFGEWGKSRQERLNARISMMERSWTDEVIVVTFFAPLWIAWIDPQQSQSWIAFIDGTPGWYQQLLFAVTAAVFGLGKAIGRKK